MAGSNKDNLAGMSKFILAQHWWAMGLRGLIAVIFGIIAFRWPQQTAWTFVMFFGAYLLVNGIFTLGSASAYQLESGKRTWLLVQGVCNLIIGLVFFIMPGLGEIIVLYVIIAWALLSGIFELLAAITWRGGNWGRFILAFGGIISLFFGLIIIARPGEGVLAIIWFIAAYAIIIGIMMILLSFSLLGIQQRLRGRAG